MPIIWYLNSMISNSILMNVIQMLKLLQYYNLVVVVLLKQSLKLDLHNSSS